jgi:hypothetical protein
MRMLSGGGPTCSLRKKRKGTAELNAAQQHQGMHRMTVFDSAEPKARLVQVHQTT